jgi:DNA-binding NtrC family response regulator
LSKPHKRILMVEDDADIRRLNSEDLRNAGYMVDALEDGDTAWEVLQRDSYNLLITDQHWPKLLGVELLKKIHDAHLVLPVIMITDILPKLEFAEHPWIQPATMLFEPYSSAELLGMVKNALATNAGVGGEIARSPILKGQPVHHGP